MEKVLITGGSGLIGRSLQTELKNRGYEPVVLSRRDGVGFAKWDIESGYIDTEALEGVTHIIHLAGESIADKRWSPKRKKAILDSRVLGAELILKELIAKNIRIKSFISASAIGYYGAVTSETIFDETSPLGDDFLADVCQKWEDSAQKFSSVADRVCIIRTGLVLAKNGGLLERLLMTAKMGLSVVFGSGKQYMPWIHIKDLCNIYIKAIEDSNLAGIYNAVSPYPVTNKEFSLILGKVLTKKQIIFKMPAFIISLIFGELGKILVTGSKVSSQKIIDAGYKFEFPNLTDALRNLL